MARTRIMTRSKHLEEEISVHEIMKKEDSIINVTNLHVSKVVHINDNRHESMNDDDDVFLFCINTKPEQMPICHYISSSSRKTYMCSV